MQRLFQRFHMGGSHFPAVVLQNSTEMGLGRRPIAPPADRFNPSGSSTFRVAPLESPHRARAQARHGALDGAQGLEAKAGAHGLGGAGRHWPHRAVEGDCRWHGALQVGGLVEADADFDKR